MPDFAKLPQPGNTSSRKIYMGIMRPAFWIARSPAYRLCLFIAPCPVVHAASEHDNDERTSPTRLLPPASATPQALMSIPTDHSFGFDPTYGFDLDALRAMRSPKERWGTETASNQVSRL